MSFRLTPLCRLAARAVSSHPQRYLLSTIRPSINTAIQPQTHRTLSPLLSIRSFTSDETPDKGEKPIIPGVGKGKTSTGIVGLAVEPDWYNVLLNKCQILLDTMEASDMPETCQFRIDVTKWCNFVIATTKANPDDPEAVEEAVNMGQVEELIEMAEDEMIAVDVYLKTRMWELVEEANTQVVFNPDPMKDEMGPDGDPDVQEQIRQGIESMRSEKKE